MTLHSIPDAAKALRDAGKRISVQRLYALVAQGELRTLRLGGKLHIVDLEEQLVEKSRVQTTARQRPQFSIVKSDRIRRFGTSEREAS